ncbi:MAG: homocysteine S-methyltransferase family protein, partial [Bacteroidales bacterium]
MQVQQAVSITKALQSQILILDGAMGTLIQNSLLDKEDKSVYDLLNLTKPELITRIHTDYLLAGAHILKTNTFNANAISLANFGLESLAYRLNFSGAQIAQQAILEFNKTQTKNKEVHFVAGCMGPTSQMRPLSFDSNTQFQKNMDFSKLKNAYYTQAKGLMEGGVDVFLIETIVDLYTAKAALYAIEDLFKEKQKQIPILCS